MLVSTKATNFLSKNSKISSSAQRLTSKFQASKKPQTSMLDSKEAHVSDKMISTKSDFDLLASKEPSL